MSIPPRKCRCSTSSYDAEYGRATGSQIRIVTGGGSQFMARRVWVFPQLSDLNANTWSRNLSTSTNFQSPFRYNQFGFNIGGPVLIPHIIPKGKMFFFFGQEWARYRNGRTPVVELQSRRIRQRLPAGSS